MGAIGRWRMRRAYNAGQDAKAQTLAWKLIDKGQDLAVAQDVLLRSHWRRSSFEQVSALAQRWPESDHHGLGAQADQRLQGHRPPSTPRKGKTPPAGFETLAFSSASVIENWHQVEATLWFRHPNGWVHWTMPSDWKKSDCHPALLELAADVLLRPWEKSVRKPITPGRVPGAGLALSWSAGTDSTAAMQLLPSSTVLGYHRRAVDGLLDHRNADRSIEAVRKAGRTVVEVASDHEIIRTHHGKMIGFSTDYASGVHLILLADHLNLGGIAFGVPIDNTWLWKGRKYRDFSTSHHWLTWSARFREAGLHLVLPINHISEAGALQLVANGPWAGVVNSCMRGDGKSGCSRCWKCFLKNGPLGRSFDLNSREISTFLNTRPLRTAQHALWAIQTMGLESHVPDLAAHLEADLSWWEEAYAPGLDLLPDEWRDTVESRTREHFTLLGANSPLVHVNLVFGTEEEADGAPEASKASVLEAE